MEQAQAKSYEIAGGFVVYVTIHGHQVNGRGKTIEEAQADLKANLDLHRRLREKCEAAQRSAAPMIFIP